MQPSATVSVFRATLNESSANNRASTNRANARHSTGPRTTAGRQRSSLNALTHGLTARSAVIPSEDPAAYEQHCRSLRDEYQPATPTETHLVQELADTAWRQNRIPLLEAEVLSSAQSPVPSPQSLVPSIASLSLHSSRLSRQFQRALAQLRTIQSERRDHERRTLREAAALSELHKYKGLPWEPADFGFVFSKEDIERHAMRLMRQNEARTYDYFRFDTPLRLQAAQAQG